MPLPFQPWRAAMQPASFRGAGFNVEVSGLATGRRTVEHEYAKRNVPFAEDMGRRARSWPVTAFLIGPNYLQARDALVAACEAEGPGTLVHPTLGTMQVQCGPCTVTESRERGGFCSVEMLFTEAGQDPNGSSTEDTQSQVSSAANGADAATANTLNTSLGGSGGIGSDTVASMRASTVQDSSLGLSGTNSGLG